MINSLKVLGVIPARGGSKGLLRKNIRLLGNKPLIFWTAEAASGSVYIDRCILSSDDNMIIDIARKNGIDVPFIRPPHLSGDKISAQKVALHALKELPGYDIVVLLQPTSPFRLSKDIDACIEACVFNNAKSSVSVCIPKKSPYWMFTQDEKGYYKPLMGWDYILHQRQQLKKILCPNGAVYVCYSDLLMSNGSFINESMACYEMPQERSIDIDDKFDMILAESILKEMNNRVLSGD